MRLSVIFDSKIDPPNASIREIFERLLRGAKASKDLEKAMETSLRVDVDEVDIFEDDSFVLLREVDRDRLFTKE